MSYSHMLIINLSVFPHDPIPSLVGFDLKLSVLAAALDKPYRSAHRQHEAFSLRSAPHTKTKDVGCVVASRCGLVAVRPADAEDVPLLEM